ncbi:MULTISPECIES: hypothetical protein [Planococcus]|uniref:hypothetical protein n=1 Tax=Planococcus TaxID=1372 RepID=UPI001B8CE3AB|nr:hypothetical protein [Planococcus sp. MSAK28401]
MVSQKWEKSDDYSQLDNQQIEEITQLWKCYLKNIKNEKPHKKFSLILKRLLQLADSQGVVFGTIKELEQTTDSTHYILSKNFNLLAKHGLLFRRNGILVVNVKAFDKNGLKNGAKDFFS